MPLQFSPHFSEIKSLFQELFWEIWEMIFPQKILCLFTCHRARNLPCDLNWSQFQVEILPSSFLCKASSETINLAHLNGSPPVNAIVQRHSAFRLSGGFSRDNEPPKSVWLSTLAFFFSPLYVLISFPHTLSCQIVDFILYS